MDNKSVLYAVLCLSLTASGSLFAQGNSPRHNNDCPDGNCVGPNNQRRSNQPVRRKPPATYQTDNNWQGQYHRATRDERGAGPGRSLHQGARLPPEYRTRQYVVEDWRSHHLSAPPRGYHWVQSGGDYLLVAITTGLIMELLLSN